MSNVVTLVDDDPSVLDAVGLLLKTSGFEVAAYGSADELLQAAYVPGCVVTDVRMNGTTGLELLHLLKEAGDQRPVILLTAHGDIEMAMRAVKSGAFDFIEKPFQEDRLINAIDAGLALFEQSMVAINELASLRSRVDSLTLRQRETMELLVQGFANKDIAAQLGISPRTVEIYRAWVMSKMGAKSLADLVHMSIRLQASGAKSAGREVV